MSIVRNNYIFIHVPKTAGTSMESIVGGTSHETIYGYHKEGIDIDKYFKWMYVRNPYDRLYSAYKHCLRSPDIFIENKQRYGCIIEDFKTILNSGFDCFIDNIHRFFDFDIQNVDHEVMRGDKVFIAHIIPQHYFCTIDGVSYINFVGKFENLENDWKKLRDILSLQLDLPCLNKGDNSEAVISLQQKNIDKINELYRKDFLLFNYDMH